MKLKERIILSTALIGIGSLFNLYFTASLHGLMSRQYRTLVLLPIGTCLSGLAEQRQQRLLFLAFEGMILLVLYSKQPVVSERSCKGNGGY